MAKPANPFIQLSREAYESVRSRMVRFTLDDVLDEAVRLISERGLEEGAIRELVFRLVRAVEGPVYLEDRKTVQDQLWSDEELNTTVRIDKERVRKGSMTSRETSAWLSAIRDKAKKIDRTADREETKFRLIQPYMEHGLTYGQAVQQYVAGH